MLDKLKCSYTCLQNNMKTKIILIIPYLVHSMTNSFIYL